MSKKGIELKSLKYHEENYRIISMGNLEELQESLRKFPQMLYARPILIEPDTMRVLAGEMKVRALKRSGVKTLEPGKFLFVHDATEEQKRRLMLKDNLHSGEYDHEKLLELEPDEKKLEKYGVRSSHLADRDDIDYGDLFNDGAYDLTAKVRGMRQTVKQALQFPVLESEYAELFEGIGKLRDAGFNLGVLVIEKLEQELNANT